MYIGQLILSGQTSYTPWFPRQSDSATFSFEWLGSGGDNPDTGSVAPAEEVTFQIVTKNPEDAGDGSNVSGASLTLDGSPTTGTIEVSGSSGLKELVRIEISSPTSTVNYDYGAGSVPVEMLRWIFFRILTPTWYDKA